MGCCPYLHAMPGTVTGKRIGDHLVESRIEPGEEVVLDVARTLTQDATGTMVVLELEAMEVESPTRGSRRRRCGGDHALATESFMNTNAIPFAVSRSAAVPRSPSRPEWWT